MTSKDLNTYTQDTLGAPLDFPNGTSPQAIAALAEMAKSSITSDHAVVTNPTPTQFGSAEAPVGRFSNFTPWLVGGSVLALAGAGLVVWLK